MADLAELQRARARAMRAKDEESVQVLNEEIARLAQERRQGGPSVVLDTPIAQSDAATDMSAGERFMAGYGKAGADLKRGAMQLIPGNGFAEVDESRRLDAPLMNYPSAQAGNLVGNVLMGMAPGAMLSVAGRAANLPKVTTIGNELIAPTSTGSAAAGGAVIGGLQPGATIDEKLRNSATGGVLAGSIQGATRLAAGEVSPNARTLLDAGVNPTPGQLRGGWANRIEEGASSIPFFGDMIKSARRGAVVDFNRAVINRALQPIGAKLPSGVSGREAISAAQSELSKAYDTILPRLTAKLDQQFVSDLGTVQARVRMLPQDRQEQINTIISEQVARRFAQGNGSAAGDSLKAIESELGRISTNYKKGASADEREMGRIIEDVQDSFRNLVQRSAANPADAAKLQAINQGWAVFKRAQRASVYAADSDGVFTPARFMQAVRELDKSKDKAAFARGGAVMQGMAAAGKDVLGDKVPDSGTPYRVAAMAGLSGAGYQFVDPYVGIGLAAAALPYTNVGRQAVAALAGRRPQVVRDVAAPFVRALPYVTIPATEIAKPRR